MKALRFALLLLAAVALFGGSAFAGGNATPEEAKAMAKRAASYLTSEGSEKAFAAFNQAGGQFHDRDLYVFVVDGTGTWVAHGFLPEKIGKNEIDAVDAGGKHYIREIVAKKHGGWVDYKFKSPADGTVRDKTSFIIKAKGYRVGVGAYKY
jgi:signal transduction histidine kinase